MQPLYGGSDEHTNRPKETKHSIDFSVLEYKRGDINNANCCPGNAVGFA